MDFIGETTEYKIRKAVPGFVGDDDIGLGVTLNKIATFQVFKTPQFFIFFRDRNGQLRLVSGKQVQDLTPKFRKKVLRTGFSRSENNITAIKKRFRRLNPKQTVKKVTIKFPYSPIPPGISDVDDDQEEYILSGDDNTAFVGQLGSPGKGRTVRVKIMRVFRIIRRKRRAIAWRDKKNRFQIVVADNPKDLRRNFLNKVKRVGFTHPINNSRVVKKNTTFTKVKPIGTVGIRIPEDKPRKKSYTAYIFKGVIKRGRRKGERIFVIPYYRSYSGGREKLRSENTSSLSRARNIAKEIVKKGLLGPRGFIKSHPAMAKQGFRLVDKYKFEM